MKVDGREKPVNVPHGVKAASCFVGGSMSEFTRRYQSMMYCTSLPPLLIDLAISEEHCLFYK